MQSPTVVANISCVMLWLLTLLVVPGCVAQRADERYRQRMDHLSQSQEKDRQAKERYRQRMDRLSQLQEEENRQQIPEARSLTGYDFSFVARGRALFNGKAVCNGCHGRDARPSEVRDPNVARLNPAPTDLRIPLDKSARQLFFTIKYGVAGTGMVPVQEDTGLSDDELRAILAYVLALQGQPTTLSDLISKILERDSGADQIISDLCATEDNLSVKSQERCEEPYRKRYRILITGRPADIEPTRYAEIQALCRPLSDLAELNQCYLKNIALARVGKPSVPPKTEPQSTI